jgi:uncharacterized membrane protein
MNPIHYLKKPDNLWLLIILAVAAALRFYQYGSFSYSNDELSALNRLYYDTFSELVAKGFFVDGHPGGIQVFLWKWVSWFGDTEWAVRLPFVIIGILSVWMSYKVARQMFGKAAGLFTAAALTFLQFSLLYSQIARPYGPGVLFGLMLVYFWLQIFFTKNNELNTHKPKLSHLAGFTISAALCMYNHYFSFLLALIVGLSGFVFARRNNIFHYISAALFAAVLFVPHIPITLNHLTYKGVGLWLGVPAKGWIFEHLYFIFDQSIFTLLLVLITLLILLYLNKESKGQLRFRLLLVAWFLLPIGIGYFYSIKVNPVLQHPVLIFSFPYFIMLIFSYAANDFDKKKQWLLAIFLTAGVIGTTAVNKYYSKQHFGEFKDIARLTAKWQQKYGDSSITKVISINNPMYIDYYLFRYQARARFETYSIEGTAGLQTLSEILKSSKNPYFLYAVTKPSPYQSDEIIRSFYPYIVDMKDYGQFSSIVLYGRQKGKTFEESNGLTEIKLLKASLKADTLIPLNDTDTLKAQKLDTATEYSPGIELNSDEFRGKENLFISAEIDLFTFDNSGESVLVISIETADGKSILWEGAPSRYVETSGKWSHVINTAKIDTEIPAGAKMKVYFWNKDKKVVYIRNLGWRILE